MQELLNELEKIEEIKEYRAIPKTRLVSGMALEKAAKSPLFPLNLRLLSHKLKFWESLYIEKKRNCT
jgi:hypothetical protein